MKILIIGVQEELGKKVMQLFQPSYNHQIFALSENSDVAPMLAKWDVEPVIGNLKTDSTDSLAMMDAVIYIGNNLEDMNNDEIVKLEQAGAIQLIQACKNVGVERFVMLSAMYADQPENAPEEQQHRLFAKNRIEHYLMNSDLTYTVIRANKLTASKGNNRIMAGISLKDKQANISVDDLAKVIIESLTCDTAYNKAFEVSEGPFPLREALYDL